MCTCSSFAYGTFWLKFRVFSGTKSTPLVFLVPFDSDYEFVVAFFAFHLSSIQVVKQTKHHRFQNMRKFELVLGVWQSLHLKKHPPVGFEPTQNTGI